MNSHLQNSFLELMKSWEKCFLMETLQLNHYSNTTIKIPVIKTHKSTLSIFYFSHAAIAVGSVKAMRYSGIVMEEKQQSYEVRELKNIILRLLLYMYVDPSGLNSEEDSNIWVVVSG